MSPHSKHTQGRWQSCEKPPPIKGEPPPPAPGPPPPPPRDSASDFYAEDHEFMPHSCCDEGLTLDEAKAQAHGYCLSGDYWLIMLHHYDCEEDLYQTWAYMPDTGCEAEFIEDMMPIEECVCVDVPCPPP